MPRFILALTVTLVSLSSIQAAIPLSKVQPFLQKHCTECHGAKKQENNKRFDSLSTKLSEVQTIQAWQEILDQLNSGSMPPEDQPRPEAKELTKVINILTAQLKAAYAQHRSTGSQTVTRRLNRFELRNTIRDLLYINDPELRVGNVSKLVDNNGNGRVENTSSDPFRSFPKDEVEAGFDNIGDRLVMSDFLLQLMLDAAEESLALATEMSPSPDLSPRRFSGHINKRGTGDLELYSRELHPDFDVLYRAATLSSDQLGGGVGTSLRYQITIEVSGHNQKHPWVELMPHDQNEPFLLGLRLFKSRTRNDHIPLVQLQLPGDGKIHTFSFETWIDKQWLPQLTWDNGPSPRSARTDLIMQKYLAEHYRKAPDAKAFPKKEEYNTARAAWAREMAVTLIENYKGPSIHVHSLTLKPLMDQWPPKSHTALYGIDPDKSPNMETLLLNFAERAFRRPVTPDEVAPYVALVQSQLDPQQSPLSPKTIENLTYKSYQGSWSKLPDFSTLTPTSQGTLDSGLLDLRPAKLDEHFGMVFEGKITAPQAGIYQFKIASDDGSRLIIDGNTVIEHDGLHGASTKNAQISLTSGAHRIRVEYFAYGKPNSLQAFWSGPGFDSEPLAVVKSNSQQPHNVNPNILRRMAALRAGYTAILCSPDFLYLREKPGQLNNYELASRLSYFLWSSMPDATLRELAKTGQLTNKSVLLRQVDRMLDDPKAAAFTRHFTERWLRLDKISDSPPERNGPFRVYWDRQFEPQLIAQTDAYFADLLKTNGSIIALIDSDYTFLNESIATIFYQRDDVKGDFLRKVPTNDPRRGGILTQPSVMTATANGVDTSPVIRGAWLLENILGTPPPPPPPDVEPLAPDLRSAKSIGEQLAIHRNQQACNNCHRKFDPLGFAFENFDPIGRWRDKYPGARDNIDTSTTTANGYELADIVELKKMLIKQEQQVTRCLTEKLLAYSSGRILEPTDRGDVDEIVLKLQANGNRLRDLIKLIVQSHVFLTK